jgi:hypothetical protein
MNFLRRALAAAELAASSPHRRARSSITLCFIRVHRLIRIRLQNFKKFLQNQKRITKISCELVTRYYILWLRSELGYETSDKNAELGALEQQEEYTCSLSPNQINRHPWPVPMLPKFPQ